MGNFSFSLLQKAYVSTYFSQCHIQKCYCFLPFLSARKLGKYLALALGRKAWSNWHWSRERELIFSKAWTPGWERPDHSACKFYVAYGFRIRMKSLLHTESDRKKSTLSSSFQKRNKCKYCENICTAALTIGYFDYHKDHSASGTCLLPHTVSYSNLHDYPWFNSSK